MKSTTWSAFHRFRVSEGIWSKVALVYLKFLNAPQDTVQIREIALQVLRRRALMHEMALMKQPPKPAEPCRVILTDIWIKMPYPGMSLRSSLISIKHQAAKTGTSFQMLILRRMHSNEITSLGVPVKSYTEWTELVDRGNLITVTPH